MLLSILAMLLLITFLWALLGLECFVLGLHEDWSCYERRGRTQIERWNWHLGLRVGDFWDLMSWKCRRRFHYPDCDCENCFNDRREGQDD